MHLHPFVLALVLGVPSLHFPAHASVGSDPRTPINAIETPGDADSVFRILQPGSYYLEANLTGVAGKCGIEVESANVRIDLMGFRLRGAEGSTSAIRLNVGGSHQFVSNGTITSWGSFGVEGPDVLNTRVSDLELFNCAAGGILLGTRSVVERCNVLATAGDGIVVGGDSRVSNCSVDDAVNGIVSNNTSLVEACKVKFAKQSGIEVGSYSIVRGTAVGICGGNGIVLGSGSSAIECTAVRSGVGILGLGSLSVIDSTLDDNNEDGVRLESGLVRGCTITRNAHRGIDVTANAHVVGNFVTTSGLDGIRTGAGSRIEDNDVRLHVNGAGIRALGTGSYIVKNTLTSNLSVIVAPNAGNFVGTLVAANAINGRSDPWANLYSN